MMCQNKLECYLFSSSVTTNKSFYEIGGRWEPVNDETDENRNERQSNVRLLANGGGDGGVANSAENNLGRKMIQNIGFESKINYFL
jgi:hypothetical protein